MTTRTLTSDDGVTRTYTVRDDAAKVIGSDAETIPTTLTLNAETLRVKPPERPS